MYSVYKDFYMSSLLSLMLITFTSPPLLGLFLLLSTLGMTLFLYSYFSSWIALILFIVYVGGLLVIFSYFLSISPNQIFIMSPLLKVFFLSISFALLMSPLDLTSTPQTVNNISTITTNSHAPMMLTLMFTLFLMLIIVVSLTKSQGSLRPFKFEGN